MSNQPDTINRTSVQYEELADNWDLVIDLCGGTNRMSEKSLKWLPKEPKEQQANYDIRVARSILFGAFKDAIHRIISKPFSKPLMIEGDDFDPRIELIKDNVDGEGTDLNNWTKSIFRTAVKLGLTHVLIDFPSRDPEKRLSRQEELSTGLHPFFKEILPNNLLFWSCETTSAGRKVLTEIRYRETAVEPEGLYGNKLVSYIKRITPTTYETYRSDSDIDTSISIPIEDSIYKPTKSAEYFLVPELSGEHTLGKIPLITYYTNKNGYMKGKPPLRSLAELNLTHYRSYSEQRNILRFARVAQLSATGITSRESQEGFVIGVNNILSSINENAEFKYVEISGKGAEIGFHDLQDIEKKMEVLSMQPFVERRADSTATSTVVNENRSTSDVKAWVQDLEKALYTLYRESAELLGTSLPENDDFKIDIFNDFTVSLGSKTDIESLISLRDRGRISTETLLSEIKRRGLFSEEFNIDEELENLEEIPDIDEGR